MIETELKSFAARAFRVAVDAHGLRQVSPTRRPDRGYLSGLRIGLRRADRAVPGQHGPAQLDVDESEQQWSAPGVAEISVRHSFVAGWRTRVVVLNLASREWTGTLRFAPVPGDGSTGWRLVAGSGGLLAWLPTEPDLPILYVRTAPSPVPVSAPEWVPSVLDLGPHRFEPGERLVLSFAWGDVRHPRQLAAVAAAALPAVPRWPCVAVGAEIWLPSDPDAALVVPDEVQVTEVGDRLALSCPEPGRHRVEVRSAGGSTVQDLSWLPTVPDFVAAAAERVLAGPVGRTGIVQLPDPMTALVVQRAARDAGFPAAAAAEDALDQYTARLSRPGSDASQREAVFGALYLAAEYHRLGDPGLVERAAAWTDGLGRPVPGLALALVRTALATVLAGGRAAPLPVPGRPDTGPAAAELIIAGQPPDRLLDDAEAVAAVYRLAIDVRAGLPGRLPPDAALDRLAYRLAVLRTLPDGTSRWWSDRFGFTVGDWLDARGLELVERLESAGSIRAAHAWLALSW